MINRFISLSTLMSLNWRAAQTPFTKTDRRQFFLFPFFFKSFLRSAMFSERASVFNYRKKRQARGAAGREKRMKGWARIVFALSPTVAGRQLARLYRIIKPRVAAVRRGVKGDGNRDGVMQKYAEFSPKVAGEVCSVDFWLAASRGGGGDGGGDAGVTWI